MKDLINKKLIFNITLMFFFLGVALDLFFRYKVWYSDSTFLWLGLPHTTQFPFTYFLPLIFMIFFILNNATQFNQKINIPPSILYGLLFILIAVIQFNKLVVDYAYLPFLYLLLMAFMLGFVFSYIFKITYPERFLIFTDMILIIFTIIYFLTHLTM